MKFGIAVCLFAVLAYHEAACYNGPARLNGNCNLEDFDQELLGMCVDLTCNRVGNVIEQSHTDCAEARCRDGSALGEPDLSKTYPACCNYRECN